MSTTTPDRSPGQIAYDAYCKTVNWLSIKGEPLPAFAGQSPQIKAAWEAAGQAVAGQAVATMRRALTELADGIDETTRTLRAGLEKIES